MANFEDKMEELSQEREHLKEQSEAQQRRIYNRQQARQVFVFTAEKRQEVEEEEEEAREEKWKIERRLRECEGEMDRLEEGARRVASERVTEWEREILEIQREVEKRRKMIQESYETEAMRQERWSAMRRQG